MMQHFGVNLGYLLVMIFNIGILLAWIILAVVCLLKLRTQPLNSTAKAVWVLIVLAIPILGAVAYLIIKPAD
jgi:hypothetical protein